MPRKIPMDAPFVTVYSQTEVVHDASQEIALPSDTDQPKLRYYEVAGMPHLRLVDQGSDGTEPHPADGDKRNDPQCQSLYDEPVETVVSAILDAMDRWVREGVPMPKAERVGREGEERCPRLADRQPAGRCTSAVDQGAERHLPDRSGNRLRLSLRHESAIFRAAAEGVVRQLCKLCESF